MRAPVRAGEWSGRLVVERLELSDVRAVEAFCDRVARGPAAAEAAADGGAPSAPSAPSAPRRVHVLINNAAQTLTRPDGWFEKMQALEGGAVDALPAAARALLPPPAADACGAAAARALRALAPAADAPAAELAADAPAAELAADAPPDGARVVAADGARGAAPRRERRGAAADGAIDGAADADGGGDVARAAGGAAWVHLDESGQPLDLAGVNSWSRRLCEVSAHARAALRRGRG